MKQFDDIFREKVAEAFSSYNADQLADKGWQTLMAARKGRRRMIWFIPLWAKAASVAVIVGLGAFIAYQAFRSGTDAEMLTGTVTTGVRENVINGIPKSMNPVTASQLPDAIEKTPEPASKPTISGSNENDRKPETSIWKIQPAQVAPLSAGNSLSLLLESELMKSPEVQITELETIEPESHKKKTRLMAGLSGLFAAGSDEGTSGAQGMALGFYVDRRITKRISFRPGIALAMNTVGLQSNRTGADKIASPVHLYNGNTGTLDHYEGHLSMLAMEIPLNFVFTVLERKKSGLYLAAGASTMIYLNQQFEGDFINEYTLQTLNAATDQYTAEKRYSTVSVSNDYGSFSRTDLLGLANFSAGYSIPYGKTGTLLIEPFIQVPLNDLTSLNLRVRYGGISMKLRFGEGSD